MSRAARHDAAAGPLPVLFVINDLLLGGAQRVVLDQAAGLDRRRFAPAVASLEIVPDGGLAPEIERAGVALHRLRSSAEHWGAGLPRLDALIRRLHPQVVHTHLALAGIVGRAAARRHRVPRVITTLHNLSDWEERRGHPLRWIDRRTLGWADALIAVSDAVRLGVAAAEPRLGSRLVTVPNGVRLEAFAGATRDRTTARAALGIDPDDFVVGAVARLDPRKGLDILLGAAKRAAPRLPKLFVLVVGDGADRGRLEALAAAPELAGRVRLAGSQPNVRQHLAAMDLFAAPSRTEGLGMAAIEALAAGVPVLGSRVGGIPEVVEHDRCGFLLPPDDVEAWSMALVRFAQEPDTRARWAATAPAKAHAFELGRCVHALEQIYVPEAAWAAAA